MVLKSSDTTFQRYETLSILMRLDVGNGYELECLG